MFTSLLAGDEQDECWTDCWTDGATHSLHCTWVPFCRISYLFELTHTKYKCICVFLHHYDIERCNKTFDRENERNIVSVRLWKRKCANLAYKVVVNYWKNETWNWFVQRCHSSRAIRVVTTLLLRAPTNTWEFNSYIYSILFTSIVFENQITSIRCSAVGRLRDGNVIGQSIKWKPACLRIHTVIYTSMYFRFY